MWVLSKAPPLKDNRENYLHIQWKKFQNSTQDHRLKPEANLQRFMRMLKCLSITSPELAIPIYLTVNPNQTILKLCTWKFRSQAEGRNWQLPSKHWGVLKKAEELFRPLSWGLIPASNPMLWKAPAAIWSQKCLESAVTVSDYILCFVPVRKQH